MDSRTAGPHACVRSAVRAMHAMRTNDARMDSQTLVSYTRLAVHTAKSSCSMAWSASVVSAVIRDPTPHIDCRGK
eukprot:scaffold92102_cov23-Tisochrysis_lutea.AAC.2